MPLWQQATSCDTPSLAYFFNTPPSSNDFTPTCSSTLTETGLQGTLTCSAGGCGAEIWSYPFNTLNLGPAGSDRALQALQISYAYPQLTIDLESFLLQISSSDSTVNGQFIARDSSGKMTLVKDYANAFAWALNYGIMAGPDLTIFATGTFTDAAAIVSFESTTRSPLDTGEPLVLCFPVGSPPIMECHPSYVSGQDPKLFQFSTAMAFRVDHPSYGTGLALLQPVGCSSVTLKVVQPPKTATTTT